MGLPETLHNLMDARTDELSRRACNNFTERPIYCECLTMPERWYITSHKMKLKEIIR